MQSVKSSLANNDVESFNKGQATWLPSTKSEEASQSKTVNIERNEKKIMKNVNINHKRAFK